MSIDDEYQEAIDKAEILDEVCDWFDGILHNWNLSPIADGREADDVKAAIIDLIVEMSKETSL